MIERIGSINQSVLRSSLDIAHIHAKRLRYALDKLAAFFPLTAVSVKGLSEEELPLFELFTSRFAKWQDLMGSSVFPRLLESVGESDDTLTLIDKLNRLEQLGVIDEANLWLRMRKLRNHIAHEYPDQPEITAEYLNQIHEVSAELFLTLERVEAFAKRQGVL